MMPKIRHKIPSAEKTKEQIAEQTLVNLTELQTYFGLTKKPLLEMIEQAIPAFPAKVTRTQWPMRAIRQWESIQDRVLWWKDEAGGMEPETAEERELLERYESKVA